MAWTTNHCCCCLSIRTGAMILGFFSLLSLLSEVEEFYPLRLAANGVAAVSFVLMIFKDSEFNRKLFFITYMISTLLMFCVGVYMAYEKLEDQEPWV